MFINLDSTPDKADPFLWADFAELRALLDTDKCFSRGDLSGIEKRNDDFKKIENFTIENRWRDITSFVGRRLVDFGSVYPFEVSDDGSTLICSSKADNACYAPYLALLLCSNLKHVNKQEASLLTRNFEEICLCVFEHLMPTGSEIRPTWASGGKKAHYKGNLYTKLSAIAKDLRCKHPNFDKKDFSPTNTGDGGVDIIAWHPMGDDRDGIPIAWAQCGCSKDQWRNKQLEASPAKRFRQIPLMHPWATYYFMPLDLRAPDGDWASKGDLASTVIFVDRIRLLRLANEFGAIQNFPNVPLVAKALDAKTHL